MTNTPTLSAALKSHFDVDDVPTFETVKPIATAIDYLATKNIKAEFLRNELRPGVVAYHRGGAVMYMDVADDDGANELAGAHVVGTLVGEKPQKRAKNDKKARKTAKKAKNDETVDESNVAPVDDSAANEGGNATESE